jgi:hypothetical protein
VERWFFWPQQSTEHLLAGASSEAPGCLQGPAAVLAQKLQRLMQEAPMFNTREALRKAILDSVGDTNGACSPLPTSCRSHAALSTLQ